MVDLATRSTAEKSRTGARMPVCDFDSTIPLTHKTDEDDAPREMYLTLLGPESEDVRRALAQMQQRAEGNKGNHSPSNAELELELNADSKMLAKLTVGGLVFHKGKWINVDSENAVTLYHDLLLLRTQAIKFMLAPGNFTKE